MKANTSNTVINTRPTIWQALLILAAGVLGGVTRDWMVEVSRVLICVLLAGICLGVWRLVTYVGHLLMIRLIDLDDTNE